MRTEEARRGLERAGMAEPHLPPGFPEMVITLKPARDAAGTHIPDACDLALHPDRGVYEIRYRAEAAGTAEFLLRDARGRTLWSAVISAAQGANLLSIPPLPAGTAEEHEILTLHMNTGSSEHELPVRLHGSALSIE